LNTDDRAGVFVVDRLSAGDCMTLLRKPDGTTPAKNDYQLIIGVSLEID
jgi:hypothetical protein